MAKDKDYKELIHKERWLKLRKQKLTANPLCERCMESGRITAATEVHHIVPVEDALSRRDKQSLMYDPHNLQALCHECHVQTHTELGRCGKEHNKRRAREHLKQFKKKFLE